MGVASRTILLRQHDRVQQPVWSLKYRWQFFLLPISWLSIFQGQVLSCGTYVGCKKTCLTMHSLYEAGKVERVWLALVQSQPSPRPNRCYIVDVCNLLCLRSGNEFCRCSSGRPNMKNLPASPAQRSQSRSTVMEPRSNRSPLVEFILVCSLYYFLTLLLLPPPPLCCRLLPLGDGSTMLLLMIIIMTGLCEMHQPAAQAPLALMAAAGGHRPPGESYRTKRQDGRMDGRTSHIRSESRRA